MMQTLIVSGLYIAALSAGLMAGVYAAFSTFIMRSLDQLGASAATQAMNAINEVILRSWFMVLFFGSTLLYAAFAIYALISPELPGRWVLFSASVIYLLGMFVSTAAVNVPLNNKLAAAGPVVAEHASAWSVYYHRWTKWNHSRGLCSSLACALTIYYLAQHA